MSQLKGVLNQLEDPTQYCKSCFKNIDEKSLLYLFKVKQKLCINCLFERKPIFKYFVLDGVKGLSIYYYNSKLRNEIYQFKGCYDIELGVTFLHPYEQELSLIYKGYIIIPMPSVKEDDEIRGFNHVCEIFSHLNLEIRPVLYKTKKVKQSDRKFKERKQILKEIEIEKNINLKDKNILLVDDIITTGNTLTAAIRIMRKQQVKDIKILVLAMNKGNETK